MPTERLTLEVNYMQLTAMLLSFHLFVIQSGLGRKLLPERCP